MPLWIAGAIGLASVSFLAGWTALGWIRRAEHEQLLAWEEELDVRERALNEAALAAAFDDEVLMQRVATSLHETYGDVPWLDHERLAREITDGRR